MNEAVLLGALLVLVGMQLAVGCVFAFFYLRQGARTRSLHLKQESLLHALGQRVETLDQRTETLAERLERPSRTPVETRDADDGVRVEPAQRSPERAARQTDDPPPVSQGAIGRSAAAAPVELRAVAERARSRPVERASVADEQEPDQPMERILQLARAGSTSADIARATGRGRGEIELLLQLYRMESTSPGSTEHISEMRSKAWA